MMPTTPHVPAGADLAELCTTPSPTGMTCLQQLARERMARACDGCQKQLSEFLHSAGLDR